MHVLPGLLRLETLISESGFRFNLLSVERSIKEPSGELTCFFNLCADPPPGHRWENNDRPNPNISFLNRNAYVLNHSRLAARW